MLSAFETGRCRPSLPGLGPILDALGADLGALHHGLDEMRRREAKDAEIRGER